MVGFNDFSKAQLSRINPSFIQEAIVKDNRDPKKMGRLKVWVQGSPSAEDNKTGWITCDYATPFAGRTTGSPNAKHYQDYPKSYGFWAVPPDINTRVFVFFVNGRMDQAYWFCSTFDHLMNNNVPGPLTKVPEQALTNAPLPVTEYDRNTQHTSVTGEYPNVPLIDSLQRQMLLYDDENGTPNRSGRRQTPNALYGLSTPRGNHIVLDDGFVESELQAPTWDDDLEGYQNTEYGNPNSDTQSGSRKNEGIVLRTRSGAQLHISESTGSILLINRDGTGRVTMDKDGNISILGNRDVSIRAKRDINFLAERDMNIDVLNNLNVRVGANYKTEVTGTNELLNVGAVRWDLKSTLETKAQGSVSLKATSISSESSSSLSLKAQTIKNTASGCNLTISGDVSVSTSVFVGDDVFTPKNSMNKHHHKDPSAGDLTDDTGSSASSESAVSAADIAVGSIPTNAYLDVVDVNPDNSISNKVIGDLGRRAESSLSTLCFLMPVTGRIQTNGYWGVDVPQDDGVPQDQSGWVIDANDSLICPLDGVIRYSDPGIMQIDHMNGYMTMFKGVNVDPNRKYKVGNKIAVNEVFGSINGNFLFEIRKIGSSLFGFEGSLDPGLFYIELTGTGSAASGKELQRGTPTNPFCLISDMNYNLNSDLVKIIGVNTIMSTLPQSGSLNQPGATTNNNYSQSSTVQQSGQRSTSTVQLPPEQDPIQSDPTPIDWVVEANDSELIKDIKLDEGTKEYQQKRGYYRNGKFQVYLDSRGYPTIGFGHLVVNENFGAGLDDISADRLLEKDLVKHVNGAKSLAATYHMKIPRVAQLVLVEMVFQLGKGGASKFGNFLKALSQGKYQTAASHLRSSLWYRQTTNRVEKHCRRLESLGGG